MKLLFSFIVSITFLCQTYVLAKVNPMLCSKGNKELGIHKMITKHSCCLVEKKNNKSSENNSGCDSGFDTGCCCTAVLAVPPQIQDFNFLKPSMAKSIFGYQFSFSEYSNLIFHPPLVSQHK